MEFNSIEETMIKKKQSLIQVGLKIQSKIIWNMFVQILIFQN